MKSKMRLSFGTPDFGAVAIAGGFPGSHDASGAVSPGKSSAFLQLAAVRAHRKLRIVLPSLPSLQLRGGHRAEMAALRAAEMAAWEASGGDALRIHI